MFNEINNNETNKTPEIDVNKDPKVDENQLEYMFDKDGNAVFNDDGDPVVTTAKEEANMDDDIVNTPDVEQGDGISWATEGIQDAVHAINDKIQNFAEEVELVNSGGGLDALSEITEAPDGILDMIEGGAVTSDFVVNEMDKHIVDIDNMGRGVANAMHDLNGGIIETDVIAAKLNAVSSQY
jgi:hypothetical protein